MTTPTARAVWFESPGVARVRTQALRDPGPGEALVRTTCSGVSAGTERLVLAGAVPAAVRGAMALPAMQGGFELPVSYGYAAVGVVERLGAGADPALAGARVLALHPHHDRFVIAAAALRPLPEGPPAARLVLGPSLETAVSAVWDAGIALGDRVLVSGLGVVGLLVVLAALRAGAASVSAVDPDPERRALALSLGASRASAGVDARDAGEADALIEVSGSPAALGALVAAAGPEAQVVVASWYGDRPVDLPLGGVFHPHRVAIRSTQVGSIAPARRGRWTVARRWALICELLESAGLDRLIAPGRPLASAPELYAELAAGVRWSPPQQVLDHEA